MLFRTKSYPFEGRLLLWIVLIVVVVVAAAHGLVDADETGHKAFGVLTLFPVLSVLALALVSKRTLEPLFAGACIGMMMLTSSPLVFVQSLMDSALKVMASPVMGWILLLSALMGGLITWLQVSRATTAFSELLSRVVKTRAQSLMAAWGLGLVIFIDDYLSALTVGAAMRRLTDKFKVSRAMLAYVAAATAAPVCLLVPISTWAIYIAGLLENNGVAAKGAGLAYYTGIIPYMFYAWVTILLVPLVAYGLIPPSPSMRAAETAAQAAPEQPEPVQKPLDGTAKPRLWHFFVPIVVMIGATWTLGDTLLGVMTSVLVTMVVYRLAKIGSLPDLFEHFMSGVSSMVTPIAIIFAAFVLQDVNDQLGLAPYLINSVKPYLSGTYLPVTAFVLLSFLTFTTGSFWGIYAIAMPIIVPLALALDANMALTLGAVVSAGGFGSHACFFGDATVLASRSCEITPLQHAMTQFRYALISALLAAVLFLALAY